VKSTKEEFAPIEEAVRLKSLPAITGHLHRGTPISDSERTMLGLPARKGGIGSINVADAAEYHYETAGKSTNDLTAALVGKRGWSVTDHLSTFGKARAEHRKGADLRAEVLAKALLGDEGPNSLSAETKRAFKRAHEHHTSGWLTVAPARSHGLALTAYEFWDGLALRFGWEPVRPHQQCTGCSKPFTMAHAQTCEVGSMRIMRHDYLKLLLTSLLKLAITANAVSPEVPIILPCP